MVPSSASICWKQRESVCGLKPAGIGGRSHAWSRSELCCFKAEISWLSFSRTSDSNVLLGWLDPSFPAFWELEKWRAGDEEGGSSRRFLKDVAGVAMMFRRADDASPNSRFCGKTDEVVIVVGLEQMGPTQTRA